ncbi:MAG: ABC transporter substrate-binding protein [Thermoflexales bacterium]|nr:ABC transporter substrate-binding protein [Thermoflexales bacterium]MDW8351672.1 ABC transporter substrate-binding protein [Anaerolineae bacterium]
MKSNQKITRRQTLKLLGLGAAGAALAACAAPPATAPAAPAAPAESKPAEQPAAGGGGKLEIFSWWTNGGEADGLNAMFEVFLSKNPGVEIVNATVAGGAGTNAKAVLQTRLAGGQPPDSWQVHAGRETLSYVNAGQLEPLTQFFTEQGFDKVMPQFLLDQLKINGEIWTVPVNIHRSNVLWYNPKILQEAGIEPKFPTLDSLWAALDKLKAAGNVVPIAVGGKDKFEASHTFESILLATFGADDYVKLWDGTDTMWNDPRAAEALENLKKLFSYANSDRSALGWADAMTQVLEGKAAMTIMGDWAHGLGISKGLKVNQDYGWTPAPGSDAFMWLSDSFGLAKGAPNPVQAKAWLVVCGSREGQDAFNPKKGSIPARTDPDLSKYDDYLKAAIADFSSKPLVPSAAHGASTTNAYQAKFHNTLEVFSSDLDAKAALDSLREAAADNNK